MPEWIIQVAPSVGGTGALMALGALWALHKGYWAPKWVLDLQDSRIAGLSADLEVERRQHSEDNDEADRRLLNALGVADKVTRMVESAAARGGVRRVS